MHESVLESCRVVRPAYTELGEQEWFVDGCRVLAWKTICEAPRHAPPNEFEIGTYRNIFAWQYGI